MGLEGGLHERPIEAVERGGQLVAREAGRLVPQTANVAHRSMHSFSWDGRHTR